ncbi:MAG: 8-oxo-dGTP diphosphatase MutT [Candidatus Aminicenantes bacterium]|nr:8-oxo-dGTP diphosphatase MutT [Candidatus Aminicenantes bacterium]
MKKKPIQVTAAVIIQNRKILIAQRKKDRHMGLKWEFPGGKIRPGETPEACLVRELQEEFSIETQIRQFFLRSVHHYHDKSIELISFLVEYKAGKFELHDHEEIKWISRDELKNYDFAAADLPIVEKLSTLQMYGKLE